TAQVPHQGPWWRGAGGGHQFLWGEKGGPQVVPQHLRPGRRVPPSSGTVPPGSGLPCHVVSGLWHPDTGEDGGGTGSVLLGLGFLLGVCRNCVRCKVGSPVEPYKTIGPLGPPFGEKGWGECCSSARAHGWRPLAKPAGSAEWRGSRARGAGWAVRAVHARSAAGWY